MPVAARLLACMHNHVCCSHCVTTPLAHAHKDTVPTATCFVLPFMCDTAHPALEITDICLDGSQECG